MLVVSGSSMRINCIQHFCSDSGVNKILWRKNTELLQLPAISKYSNGSKGKGILSLKGAAESFYVLKTDELYSVKVDIWWRDNPTVQQHLGMAVHSKVRSVKISLK